LSDFEFLVELLLALVVWLLEALLPLFLLLEARTSTLASVNVRTAAVIATAEKICFMVLFSHWLHRNQ
jgi:uncharacterized membrane protein YbhN (UPF0104 family)